MTTDDSNSGGTDKPESGGAAPGVSLDFDEKLRLIESSYEEVLDATKHQDDKIGQLLTSIAFLTAATLALAALESASFITRTFIVKPFDLPLGLITLTVFLVGVVFSVMLLLTSLSTPLRLPGIGGSRRTHQINWAGDVSASQIYFFEIAGVSLDEWQLKWDESAGKLREERFESLVRETHNLGLRTSAKYDRTTEAVGLLSMSLLAFALAIIFVAIVASSPAADAAIGLQFWQRAIIGGIFAVYCWLQLIGRIRYDRQAVDETPQSSGRTGGRRKYIAELTYSVLIALLMEDLIIYNQSWPGGTIWATITSALALAAIITFWHATSQVPIVAIEDILIHRIGATLRSRWLLTIATVALAGFAILGGLEGWYACQLGAASLGVLCLIAVAVLQPTFRLKRRRQEYRVRLGHLAESEAPAPI